MASVTREVREMAVGLAHEVGLTDIYLRGGNDEQYGVAVGGYAVKLADYSEQSLRFGINALKDWIKQETPS